jgi:ketosteroid isomerase-like protein
MIKKISITIALTAMSLTWAASASAFAAGPSESLAEFHAALAAGDKTKAMAILAPEVAIYESGYVEGSRSQYASHHLGDDIGFAKTTTRKVLKHSERIEGNVAVIFEETETTGTAQGKPIHAFGTETAILERKADGWSIIHVHWSSRKAK